MAVKARRGCRPGLLAPVVVLVAAGAALGGGPTWLVERDGWVETYVESLNAVCRLEAAAGAALPEDRNTTGLPLVLYPPTNAGLADVPFRLNVSGAEELYVGSRRWVQVLDGRLIAPDGREVRLAEKNACAVPFGLVNPRRGRAYVRNDLQVGEGEVMLHLGGRYAWMTGRLRARDVAVVWIDRRSRWEPWGGELSPARRMIRREVERIAQGPHRDPARREEARRQVDRAWRALPTIRRPMTPRQVAAAFAANLETAFGRVDERIARAVRGAASAVRTGRDLDRLVSLAQAAPQYGRLRALGSRARGVSQCPGLYAAWEALERDFLRLDAAKMDYGWELTKRLDAFEKTIAECVEAAGYVDLARRTIGFVDRVRPVPASTRQRLERLAGQLEHSKDDLAAFLAVRDRIRALRREVLFSHPALDFDRILINRCPPPAYSHNGDQHLGRHSRVGPGLTVLTDWKGPHPKATAILAGKLPPGSTRNPDLHYDAEKVVFAFCDHTRDFGRSQLRRFFLYEAAVDGSWVRQLTGTRRDPMNTWGGRATVLIEDNDPAYLPDDDIVFVSTRGQTFGRCHGGRYNPAWVLHRCDADGGNIRQLSFGNENEYEPSVLNDGRIVFTRWEYTNRHEMLFHMLWTCNPDGSNVANFYGNDTLDPMMVVEATALPGSSRVVATAQGHHSYNTGTTVVLDTARGENGEAPVTHITPETPYSESHGWPSPHYSHPYPITGDLFLVSRANHPVHHQGQVPPVADRGIYLVDTLGGRELIYEDPNVASFSPIPIRRRPRPPVLPAPRPREHVRHGTVFVRNVYRTRNDPEGVIRPGMIRAIRVNAIGVQPRAGRSPCSLTVPVEIPKKVLGTVPVNPDGSAYFQVPARVSLQLQLLDANDMAVLTERSFFYLQPGETRSCVGCHEPEATSPTVPAVPAGIGRPATLSAPAGPKYPGGLSFMRTVQPVLDRYCIRCHGLEKTEKGVNLILDDWRRPRSALALIARGEHRIGLKSYTGGEKNISRPRRYFAWRNRVAHMLRANHGKVDMDRDSYLRIIEWLDLNAQVFGDLFPGKLEERRIDPKALAELRDYIRQCFGDALASQPERALINVAQVDESRILMAPLARAAGGWGQIPGWKSRSEPGYRKMAELVEKCIVRRPNENRNGWLPSLECGGGERWVMEARRQYRQFVGAEPAEPLEHVLRPRP